MCIITIILRSSSSRPSRLGRTQFIVYSYSCVNNEYTFYRVPIHHTCTASRTPDEVRGHSRIKNIWFGQKGFLSPLIFAIFSLTDIRGPKSPSYIVGPNDRLSVPIHYRHIILQVCTYHIYILENQTHSFRGGGGDLFQPNTL